MNLSVESTCDPAGRFRVVEKSSDLTRAGDSVETLRDMRRIAPPTRYLAGKRETVAKADMGNRNFRAEDRPVTIVSALGRSLQHVRLSAIAGLPNHGTRIPPWSILPPRRR